MTAAIFRVQWSLALAAICVLAAGCTAQNAENSVGEAGAPSTEDVGIQLMSSVLTAGEPIPDEFTGDGDDVSPPLAWKGLPEGTQQLTLICDDPDAPTPQPWVHWVIYNIPADVTELPKGIAPETEVEEPEPLKGALQGVNGWGQTGYRGPAPPPGDPHHYHFKLYALDQELDFEPGMRKTQLLEAMEGHIIGQGELVATYQR